MPTHAQARSRFAQCATVRTQATGTPHTVWQGVDGKLSIHPRGEAPACGGMPLGLLEAAERQAIEQAERADTERADTALAASLPMPPEATESHGAPPTTGAVPETTTTPKRARTPRAAKIAATPRQGVNRKTRGGINTNGKGPHNP